MALTIEEKAKLTQIYEPILHFHPDELFKLSDPRNFMRNSAMWCSQPTVPKRKENWGDCSHEANTPFPRIPLIPRGRLSVDPEDEEFEGADFVGTEVNNFRKFLVSNEERELFLQTPPKGWVAGVGSFFTESGPDTESPLSAENAPEGPAYQENPIYAYYVDVRDQDTASDIPVDEEIALPPSWPNAMRALYPTGYWLLTFYFFYTYHVERLTDCEIDSEIFRALRSGDPLPRAIRSSTNLDDLHGGDPPTGAFGHGSYAGDWQAVSVLVRNPGQQTGASSANRITPVSPLNLADEEFPKPDDVGFSRRARGVDTHIGSNLVKSSSFTFMPISSIEKGEVQLVGTHVKVFVSKGTHNNYASPGNPTAPKFDSSLPFPIDFFDACEAADDALTLFYVKPFEIREEVEEGKRKIRIILISIAKILTLGLIGIGAALSEGLGQPQGKKGMNLPHGPENVPDEGPREVDGGIGVVLCPFSLVDQLSEELENQAEEVRGFSVSYGNRVIDRDSMRQLWWSPDATHPLGYQGRWGVVCERDPFDRRSGTKIPLFEASFISAFLRKNG